MKVLITENPRAAAPRRFAACFEGEGTFAYGPTPEAARAALVARPEHAAGLADGAANALASRRSVEGQRLDMPGR